MAGNAFGVFKILCAFQILHRLSGETEDAMCFVRKIMYETKLQITGFTGTHFEKETSEVLRNVMLISNRSYACIQMLHMGTLLNFAVCLFLQLFIVHQ